MKYLIILILFVSLLFSPLAVLQADPDLWGHIKYGEYINKNKDLPRYDLYSYTVYKLPVVHHEWGSELIFYYLYNKFGDVSLIILKLVIGIIISIIFLLIINNFTDSLTSLVIIFFLSVRSISGFFLFRPQIFTFLFFSFFVYLIYLYRYKRKNYLYLLPFLSILWINLHGGFLLGLFYLLLIVISSFIRREKDFFYFLKITLISFLCTLINPNGFSLYKFFYYAFNNPLTRVYISDWKPIPIFSFYFIEYKIILILLIISVLFSTKKRDFTELLIVISFSFLSLYSRRHIPLFVIASLSFLSFHTGEIINRRYGKLNLVIILPVIFASLILNFAFYPKKLKIEKDVKYYPVSCVEFMKLNKIYGNVFCLFDWGEYITYHLYPNCKVSIDGRYDTVYPVKIIKKNIYPLFKKDKKYLKVPFEEKTSLVLIEKKSYLCKKLKKEKRWLLLFEDSAGSLFVKNTQKNKEIIFRKYNKSFSYPKSVSHYFP